MKLCDKCLSKMKLYLKALYELFMTSNEINVIDFKNRKTTAYNNIEQYFLTILNIWIYNIIQ